MKPIIIVWNRHHVRFEALNESASLIGYSYISFPMLAMEMEEDGFELVPLNSRFARTILDKINNHSI